MDVSLSSFEMKKRSIFYIITFEYKPGNICDTEYYLESSYIENVIENAKFIYNSHNLNLKEMIKDKEPIVGNILYLGNDYTISIDYKLKDKYETMYIFYKDDLLIFQIGHRDEGTKFISYR